MRAGDRGGFHNEKEGEVGKSESFTVYILPTRYMFMPAKNPFGDCGGNITDSENGFIKSPNYPEKYTTNDQSK